MVGYGKYILFFGSHFAITRHQSFHAVDFILLWYSSMVLYATGVLPKQEDMVISPILGTLEHAEETEEGMRFIGKTKSGYYISVDVTETEMIANIRGLIIMIRGEYLERANGHYRIYDKSENTYANLDVGPDDVFRLIFEIRT